MATIEVIGIGNLSTPPNEIEITIHLATTEVDYDVSIVKANENLEKLRNCLRSVGVNKENLVTTHFNVNKREDNVRQADGNFQMKFVGYETSHSLKVVIAMDTTLLGQVISAISISDTNCDFNIRFTLSDPAVFKNKLISSAIKDAKGKAKVIARNAELVLGEIVSIKYGADDKSFYSPTSYQMNTRALMRSSAIDIVADEVKQTEQVRIIWEAN